MNLLKKFFALIIFVLILAVVRFNLIEFHMFEMFVIMPLLFYISLKFMNYDKKMIKNYFGIDMDLNEDDISYIKNIYEKKIKRNSILVLAMTPFVYCIEFFIDENYKIFNTFFLNRILQGPFLFGAIILLLTTPIFVKRQYLKRIKSKE
ncbi:hypothetical protein Ccar_14610 [Clostridium carboxidivorans P7]|uniref:Uncharacterized protein n=1 Tax=Clostridium carboxidivorans P7 TaxID=536227 RepID=C6Q0R8_9CLOT|nr:hypothetical protein [Clostridium carboxidivorans]AKN32028.1 hypothetical protein Ccar_14610 [Clostridium carboxidivorans P7]EET84922.1 hypothetical protein CcarbDRAFT_4635 [Clostridium carboxidivorans P7]EFG87831.1 hypothetical protein CLCAR_2432 [Clostridium carboxidivorans P7]